MDSRAAGQGPAATPRPARAGWREQLLHRDNLARAFPGSKSADAGLGFGSSTVLAEVVSATAGVAAREQGDVAAFRKDTEKVVVKKARQLSQSALDLLADPQPAGSPLGKVAAKEVFPVAVRDGHYPVNPITRRYLEEEWSTTEGLFHIRGSATLRCWA
ncbi:hypothetical protein [Streptomyces sp. NPDC048644]|uniref:hypothetical protein n=1 Tax=Streptomyces sp. NPDC048644 TaxID=3365582 RepID=UPI0037208B76